MLARGWGALQAKRHALVELQRALVLAHSLIDHRHIRCRQLPPGTDPLLTSCSLDALLRQLILPQCLTVPALRVIDVADIIEPRDLTFAIATLPRNLHRLSKVPQRGL